MGRRKRGRDVHGWLVLDKAYDMGSTEAVSAVRRLFDAKKAGHAGTLDPLATGVLAVALGEATKTAPFIQDAAKTYRFTARFGLETTTDDLEGEPREASDARPSDAAIEAALPGFVGAVMQRPPAFSAVKIRGERAYDLARAGVEVQIAERPADVLSFRLVERLDADHATFEAVTGKGVYVRALVRDLARAVGARAHVSELRRAAVGPFRETDATTLERLAALAGPEERLQALAPVDAPLAGLPQAEVHAGEAAKLRRGQACVLTPPAAKGVRAGAVGVVETVLARCGDAPVAICALDGLALKPSRVFNL